MSKIKATTTTFEDLMKDVREGRVKVPTFQRNFVWQQKDIVLLLDSIYRKFPIGSFIFWKTDKKLDHHREICERPLKDIPEGRDINYVLDGQQRITSLYSAIEHGRKDNNACIYFFDLKKENFDYELVEYDYNPERTKEQNLREEMDIITQKHRKLEENNKIPLNKIFVDAPTYTKYMMSFPLEYQQKVHALHGTFTNYPFPVIELTEETDLKKICKIFDRINSTGKKLTVVSLMVAKAWAEDFNLRHKLNLIRTKFAEFGEVSEVTILQTASVILNDKKCKKKDIEETNINELRDNWDKVEKSLELSIDYLRQKFNVTTIDYLPFDSIIVVLAYLSNKHKNLGDYDTQINEWFWKACLSNRYDKSKEAMIEKDCEKFDLILTGKGAKFDYSIDWNTMRARIIEQKYYLGNAFCKTILTLYAYQKPRDFDDNGTELIIAKTFSDYNKKNMHHVFARGYFKNLERLFKKDNNDVELKRIETESENVESIANIMFIPFNLNKKIDCEEPKIYFEKLSVTSNFAKIMGSHIIGDLDDFGIRNNDFPRFLEKRAELIEKKLAVLTKRISKISDELREDPKKPLELVEKELRKKINEKLQEKYGDDYWQDDKIIPQDIKEKVKKKIEDKLKRHPYDKDKYETSFSKLEFFDVMDYSKVIFRNKDLFENLFLSQEEFEKSFKDLNYFRNPLLHHHNVINEVEKLRGDAAIMWFTKVLGLDKKKSL